MKVLYSTKECHNCGFAVISHFNDIDAKLNNNDLFDDLDVCPFCNSEIFDGKLEYGDNVGKIIKQFNNRIYEEFIMGNDEKEELYEQQLIFRKKWKQKYSNSIYNKIKSKPNIPTCPTCGSTRIRKISNSERATNAIVFGLYGNKRKCQFECLNPQCKYRW